MMALFERHRRSAPADDRRVVARRRALPPRRARGRRTGTSERSLTLYDPAFHGAARLADRHRARHLLPLRAFADADAARLSRSRAAGRPARRRPTRGARSSAAARVRAAVRDLRRTSPGATPREVQRTYEQLAIVCHSHGIAQEMHWAAPLVGRAFIELGDLEPRPARAARKASPRTR